MNWWNVEHSETANGGSMNGWDQSQEFILLTEKRELDCYKTQTREGLEPKVVDSGHPAQRECCTTTLPDYCVKAAPQENRKQRAAPLCWTNN